MPGETLTRSRSRVALGRFARHYVEMLVAMFVGMMLLGPLWTLVWPGLDARADLDALVMATDMAIGMAAWMLVRRNSWSHIAEMTGAMYVPFVVLLVPYWMGMISGDVLMTGGHVLMLVTMAAVMLRPHRGHARPA